MQKILIIFMIMVTLATGCSEADKEQIENNNSTKIESQDNASTDNGEKIPQNTNSNQTKQDLSVSTATAMEVECPEPIPAFMYGGDSNDVAKRIDLCTCIWESIPEEMKPVSKSIREGQPETVTTENINVFFEKLNEALNKCNK